MKDYGFVRSCPLFRTGGSFRILLHGPGMRCILLRGKEDRRKKSMVDILFYTVAGIAIVSALIKIVKSKKDNDKKDGK